MNDPDFPQASRSVQLPSPETTVKPSSERVRLFTPIDVDPSISHKRFGRLIPMDASVGDRLEPGSEEIAEERTSGSRRPALVPNSAIPFLQQVHASSNPEKLNRRVSAAARTLAYSSLALGVGLAIASGFVFKARPQARTKAGPATPSASSPALPALTAADSARHLRDALTALDAFIQAPTAEEQPTPLDRMGHSSSLSRVEVDRDDARLLVAQGSKVVLVPVTDAHGLPHTAAVVHRGDAWRVDARSLITPETAGWKEIVSGTLRGPHLCRVLLSRGPEGGWMAARPAATAQHNQVATAVAPGSRVAEELVQALADRAGAPLAADVYFESAGDHRLNIVDWTRDKWSL